MSTCNLSQLIHLYEQTPNLEHLSITFYDNHTQLQLSPSFLSIIRLEIFFIGNMNTLTHLFQYMPNLYHLKFESENIYIDGHQWEQIIGKYLLKLKIFQFRVEFSSKDDEYQRIHLDGIIDTFRTEFWIDEHQWFVRGHCRPITYYQAFRTFSLPYAFHEFPDDPNGTVVNSTWPYDNESLTYDRVLELSYKNSCVLDIRFSNIQTLSLLLPFNDQFLIIVAKLDRLTSLEFYVEKDGDLDRIQLQIQQLLDQASCVRSLTFGRSLNYDLPMKLTSNSVRRIDIEKSTYDRKQCAQLSRSPLGRQCTTLIIQVKHPHDIVDLVKRMPHLQALKVRLENDNTHENYYEESIKTGAFLERLHLQLTSPCTITSRADSPNCVFLWFH